VKPQPLAHAAFHPNIFHRRFVSDRLMINENWHGETMDAQRHWENIYGKKAADAVSWHRPHLETSLELIERTAPEYSASTIDIGGGESTLVDDLLARGYQNISVLDISQTAPEVVEDEISGIVVPRGDARFLATENSKLIVHRIFGLLFCT
jgi:carbamoylphosphate synthase small subunit